MNTAYGIEYQRFIRRPSIPVHSLTRYKCYMRDMRCPNAQKEDNTRVSRLATGRQCRVVHMVRRVDAKAPARKRLPERALVSTRVAVGVCLDDGVASSEDC